MDTAIQNYTVYCIPGLGVNKQLFKNLQLPHFNISFIDWITPVKNEILPAYAMRLAEQIDTSKPFILIGVSFGGMCAIEITKQLSPVKTILISSSKTKIENPSRLRILSFLPLHYLLSDSLYLKGAWILRRLFGVHAGIAKEFKASLTPPPENFFARAVNMIVHWKNKTVPANVIHIHGTADRVLPYKKSVRYDYTIEKGSHLMILDRGEEISRIITSSLHSLHPSIHTE